MREDPLCVFCGTPRPAEVEACPNCGRPWIDRRLDDLDAPIEAAAGAPPEADEVVARARTTRASATETATADASTRRIPHWTIAAGVGLAAFLTYGIVFGVILDQSSEGTTATTLAAPTSAAAQPPLTSTAPPPPTTPDTTTAPTSTTSTTTTTTTTTTLPPLPALPALGEPMDVADLDLKESSIGDFRFLTPAEPVLGRLAATFGQPDAIEPLDGTAGLCEGETGRSVRWGHLTVVTRDAAASEQFVAYRVGDDAAPPDHPTAALETLSGAAVGITLAELNAIYGNLERIDIDGQPHYLVLAGTDRRTLLWGPLDGSADQATVEGIYSPRPCDRGPFPN